MLYVDILDCNFIRDVLPEGSFINDVTVLEGEGVNNFVMLVLRPY